MLGSGRGGLLCPRLMTGMWGGRGEDNEDERKGPEEVGVGSGLREVLTGAGRSGGGDESVGEPSAETVRVAMVIGASLFTFSVSMTIDSGAAAVPVLWLVNTAVVALGDWVERAGGKSLCSLRPVLLAGCGLLTEVDGAVLFWMGLCCSSEAQDGEEAEEEE